MKWVIAVILGHLNDRQRLFGSSMPRRVRCSQCGRAILQLGIFGSGEYSSKCLTMVIFSLVLTSSIIHGGVPDLSPFGIFFGDKTSLFSWWLKSC